MQKHCITILRGETPYTGLFIRAMHSCNWTYLWTNAALQNWHSGDAIGRKVNFELPKVTWITYTCPCSNNEDIATFVFADDYIVTVRIIITAVVDETPGYSARCYSAVTVGSVITWVNTLNRWKFKRFHVIRPDLPVNLAVKSISTTFYS